MWERNGKWDLSVSSLKSKAFFNLRHLDLYFTDVFKQMENEYFIINMSLVNAVLKMIQ